MILLPYTHEIPEDTFAAALAYPNVLAFVGNSDTAYWELLNHWWKSDEPWIMTIEHDIEVNAFGIQVMLECPNQWCAAMYPFEGGEIFGLGFTKFALGIRLAVPDALDQVGKIDQTPVHPPMHWCSMDAWLQGVLRTAGQSPHIHRVPIRHRGNRRSHLACR